MPQNPFCFGPPFSLETWFSCKNIEEKRKTNARGSLLLQIPGLYLNSSHLTYTLVHNRTKSFCERTVALCVYGNPPGNMRVTSICLDGRSAATQQLGPTSRQKASGRSQRNNHEAQLGSVMSPKTPGRQAGPAMSICSMERRCLRRKLWRRSGRISRVEVVGWSRSRVCSGTGHIQRLDEWTL